MTISAIDQRALHLSLIEGIHETPPFGLFMRNLVALTGARRAFMLVQLANAAPGQEPAVIHVTAPRAAQEPPLDFVRLHELRLHPYGALRPERVYALDEMLDFDNPAQLERQKEALADMDIRYGRWLRIRAGGAADAWLVLVRQREDFTASAVATLSAVAPHLASALRTLVALVGSRLQAALAQSALARLGIGQVALDAAGRVMAADPGAEALLSFAVEPEPVAGRRLQLVPATARMLERACAEIASGVGDLRVMSLDARRGIDIVLRRSDLRLTEPDARPEVVGTLRVDRRENEAAGAAVLQAVHGLSLREAELAIALSRGEPLVEAGMALGLTAETARNYSKRIYAKTGATGQADLVRMILTGLAPLA